MANEETLRFKPLRIRKIGAKVRTLTDLRPVIPFTPPKCGVKIFGSTCDRFVFSQIVICHFFLYDFLTSFFSVYDLFREPSNSRQNAVTNILIAIVDVIFKFLKTKFFFIALALFLCLLLSTKLLKGCNTPESNEFDL